MKVVAYCRLSSDEEAAGSVASIDEQKAAIDEFCADRDMQVVDTLVDHTGIVFGEARPEFDKLVSGGAAEGVEAVVVASTDRIAGNVKQFLFIKQQLTAKGLKVLCAEENSGETGAGKFAPVLGRS